MDPRAQAPANASMNHGRGAAIQLPLHPDAVGDRHSSPSNRASRAIWVPGRACSAVPAIVVEQRFG